ncbi:hypothetical protein JHS3_27090 [Jeongeupia sp. HS-3]|uniref:MCP four helix bundle domain-containing protein n=1 Tax=Jeongeupia sp. HS-3 TaxID=1009682 RepID=UPI0018A355E3|nr:MCP four helix bundle domain-containing protein [Jeongeupia sp. HS-3]BCL76973.1 hypothetical protein JHS3_27090 [Jeongeupia sp. HS-3]
MTIPKLSIGLRLAIGFAAILLLMAALALFAWQKLAQLETQLQSVVHSEVRQLQTAHRLKALVLRDQANVLALFVVDQPAKAEKLWAQIGDARRQTRVLVDGLPAAGTQEAMRAALDRYDAGVDNIRELLDIGARYDAMTEVNLELRQRRDTLLTKLDTLVAASEAGMAEASAAGAVATSRARAWLIGLTLLAMAVGAFAGWRITRAIVSELGLELGEAVGFAADLAGGRLRLGVERKGFRPGSLMDSLLAMRDRIVADWIYAKTTSGARLIEARDRELDGRERQLLVLLDGRRNLAELSTIFGEDVWAQLRTLEAQGLAQRREPVAA